MVRPGFQIVETGQIEPNFLTNREAAVAGQRLHLVDDVANDSSETQFVVDPKVERNNLETIV
jgi:hypothetical protein